MTILIGNIGSGKSELALYDHTFNSVDRKTLIGKKSKSVVFESMENYQGNKLSNIVANYLEKINYSSTEDGDIYAASFGVSGPVSGSVDKRKALIDRENFKAELTTQELRDKLPDLYSSIPIAIMNDMEAIGYAVLGDGENELESLNTIDQEIDHQAPKAIMLVSGGLGQIVFFFDECTKSFSPLSSEGGHTLFAPRTYEEIKFLSDLMGKGIPTPITYEYVLSAPGLVRIYNFIVKEKSSEYSESEELRQTLEQDKDNPELIIQKAFDTDVSDPLCMIAIDMFMSIWGARAGDIALTYLAKGGLYLGGIPIPSEKFKKCGFLDAFLDKERDFRTINEKIPIKIFQEEDIVLKGAARYVINQKYITIGRKKIEMIKTM